MTEDNWTPQHEEAVLLVAEDAMTDVAIAAKLGISKRTLEYWKAMPLFGQKLDKAIADMRAALKQRGIARLDRRLARLNKTWLALQEIIQERSEELAGECPGGETGLIIKQQKQLGKGFDSNIVDEYVVDGGILSELRALEMQAAKELGQWTEKRDVTSGGQPVAAGPDLRGLPTERLRLLKEILSEAASASDKGTNDDGQPAQPA